MPKAELTILLDIAPELAVERKANGRDRYERDLELLARVRQSYLRQAEQVDWALVNGDREQSEVADEIMAIVSARLSPA